MRVRRNRSQRVVLVVHFNESQAAEWARAGFIRRDGSLWRSTLERESRVLSSVDGIVYVSDFMRREVEQRVPGAVRVPKALIPNFVQAPPAGEAGTLPPTELVSIGTLEPRKNQSYALEVLAELHRQGWPVALTLIGAGPDQDALAARVQALGLAQHVRFAGYVAGASSHLSRFKAYLHVAQMENFPLVLVEAMARGLPVFAPDTGGTAEAFTQGVEGWVIPLDNAVQAANIIGEQLADAAGLQRAAQAARARFTEHYETSRLATRLFDFLQSRRADALQAG
jgi:glycosyltransferase involved in cell wall biosynthesis